MRNSRVHIDDSELRNLQVDISGAPIRAQLGASKVVRRGAKIIDKGMTDDAKNHTGNYFGIVGTEFDTKLNKHVSHEMIDPLEAEIGIEQKGSGRLAHIIVFGSVNNAPVYDHTAALRRNTPAILQMFADELETAALGEGGGDHS